jgi:hypothetical protein
MRAAKQGKSFILENVRGAGYIAAVNKAGLKERK